MAHGLITGMTMSGKTTLAKALASQIVAQGSPVIVLDPLSDPGWNTQFCTSDPQQFLKWYWQSRCAVAFIDESGQAVGRYNLPMTETATRGRHWGHVNFYIMQEATQIAPIIRSQCSTIYLFTSSAREGLRMSEEFNAPELMQCTALPQGHYMKATRFGGVQRGRVF